MPNILTHRKRNNIGFYYLQLKDDRVTKQCRFETGRSGLTLHSALSVPPCFPTEGKEKEIYMKIQHNGLIKRNDISV